MNRIITIISLISSSLLMKGLAQTTINLPAVKDNTIYSESGNSNGSGPNFTCGNNSAGNTRRGLLKFNLTGIPNGATINSVTLTLTLTKSKTGDDNVSLYKLNQDWGEGASNAGDPDGQGTAPQVQDATWTCSFFDGAAGCAFSWGTLGGVFTAAASATTLVLNFSTTNTWSSTQMKNDVQGWLNSPATNFGWILRAGVVGSSESGSRTTNRFASRENANAGIRPNLSVTYTGGAAPVTLSNFLANETKQGVLLSWQTSAEYNNAYFAIEHSTDGTSFSSVGRVNGAGTSSLKHKYQFIHQGVINGKHFYRLAQTDIDGTFHYSEIVSVISKSNHLLLVITPNPVKEILNVSSISLSPSTGYSITNSSGSIVKSGILRSYQIPVEALSAGLYMLKISQPTGEFLSGVFVKR